MAVADAEVTREASLMKACGARLVAEIADAAIAIETHRDHSARNVLVDVPAAFDPDLRHHGGSCADLLWGNEGYHPRVDDGAGLEDPR